MTRKEFMPLVKTAFAKRNPDWKPEFPNEIANVTKHLLDEGQITLKTKPGRAANIVADFIGIVL